MMTKPEDILTAYQHSTIIFPLQSDTADLRECTRQARRKLKHKQTTADAQTLQRRSLLIQRRCLKLSDACTPSSIA